MSEGMSPATKVCTHCKIEKPSTEFYKNRCTKDGLSDWCKSCLKISTKNWQRNNKDRLKEIHNNWKMRNPEKLKECVSSWKSRNHEKVKQYVKRSYQRRQQKDCCEIIRQHHEDLKDDPERLSSDFIKSLVRVKCGDNNV